VSEKIDLAAIIASTKLSALGADSDTDSGGLKRQEQRFRNNRYKTDTQSRTYLAYWAATVVTIYLGFVIRILFSNYRDLCLSDSVLMMLLGTTTVNVLGLMYIVLKGYFNANFSPSNK